MIRREAPPTIYLKGACAMATGPMNQSGCRRWPSARWLLSALGLTAVLLAVVLVAPRLLYPALNDQELDRDKVTGRDRVQLRNDRLRLQNDARATLLQGLAGGVLLLGAYFTWRQVQVTRQQLYLTEQGQLTERFTRAVDQLGSDRLDVRLGGIYALERSPVTIHPTGQPSARSLPPTSANAPPGRHLNQANTSPTGPCTASRASQSCGPGHWTYRPP